MATINSCPTFYLQIMQTAEPNVGESWNKHVAVSYFERSNLIAINRFMLDEINY